jgi:hypothetical protein
MNGTVKYKLHNNPQPNMTPYNTFLSNTHTMVSNAIRQHLTEHLVSPNDIAKYLLPIKFAISDIMWDLRKNYVTATHENLMKAAILLNDPMEILKREKKKLLVSMKPTLPYRKRKFEEIEMR